MTAIVVQGNDATTTTGPAVPFLPGDIVVVLAITLSSANASGTVVSGLGGTWTRVYLGAETSIWVTADPTTPGFIDRGNAASGGWWHIRGAAPAVGQVWDNYKAPSVPFVTPLVAPNATVAPTQVALAFSRRAATMNGTTTSGGWAATVGSSTNDVALQLDNLAATATASTTTTWTTNPGNETWHVQFVVGSLPPPDPPTGLVVTGVDIDAVSIAWTAPVAGGVPTGYDVRIDSGAPVDVGLVLAHTFAGLLAGTTHVLEVRTRSASGVSGWVSIEATTLDPAPPDRRWWTHRLAAAVGLDSLADQPVVQVRTWNGAAFVVDDTLSRALQSYQVTYGRKDATGRVEALTASLVWATPALASTPTVATRLQVALSPAVCAALGLDPVDGIRFTGEVADPAVAYARRLTSAACAGRLGRAHRMPVDGTGWPVEDDGDRIARILPAAGVGLQVGTIDSGSVAVATPTRLETVATLLEQVSVSALGQVVEQPSGVVDWHDANHRRTPAIAASLTAGHVLRDVTWTQRLASLVNDLDVKTAAGTVVTIRDPESSDPNRYGPFPASVDTILTSSADAQGLGVDIVGRRADPSWQLPDLTVDLVRTIPTGLLPDVLALRHGSLLELTDLPPTFPNKGRVFVEGYTETATPRTWQLTMSVSDPLQSGVGIRWIDWPDDDAYQWQDLGADVTWLDLARIYDPADTLL